VESESKRDTVIIGANGTISQSQKTIPEQHTSKAQIQKLKKRKKKASHIGHCTHAMENANVKVQNVFHWQNITLHVAQMVNTEQLQHINVVCCR
jgi:hypothetical protein